MRGTKNRGKINLFSKTRESQSKGAVKDIMRQKVLLGWPDITSSQGKYQRMTHILFIQITTSITSHSHRTKLYYYCFIIIIYYLSYYKPFSSLRMIKTTEGATSSLDYR